MQHVSRDRARQKGKEMRADLSRSQIESLIDEWLIGRNAERDRAILKRRLLDGICFEPLSEEFGLSVRQTKNIVYSAEKKIFKHI